MQYGNGCNFLEQGSRQIINGKAVWMKDDDIH